MVSNFRRLLLILSLSLPTLHALSPHHHLPHATLELPSSSSLAFQLHPSLYRSSTNPVVCPRVTSGSLHRHLPERRRIRLQAGKQSVLKMSETTQAIATGVGYMIGAGSVLLYTPMIYRIFRRQSAAGLVSSLMPFCTILDARYSQSAGSC